MCAKSETNDIRKSEHALQARRAYHIFGVILKGLNDDARIWFGMIDHMV